MDAALGYLLLIGALGAALAVLGKYVVRPLMRVHGGLSDFLEDWNGRPDRPGVKGHPGAMVRLAQLENNGGRSIKDTVERTARDLSVLSGQFATHLERSDHERAAGKRIERELREAIANLSDALPVVARSTPPNRGT